MYTEPTYDTMMMQVRVLRRELEVAQAENVRLRAEPRLAYLRSEADKKVVADYPRVCGELEVVIEERDRLAAQVADLTDRLAHPEYQARLYRAIESEPETVVELITKRDQCIELREMLAELAGAFQYVYEGAYAPAPAGENGTYSASRALLARLDSGQET